MKSGEHIIVHFSIDFERNIVLEFLRELPSWKLELFLVVILFSAKESIGKIIGFVYVNPLHNFVR